MIDGDALREMQRPLKELYRDDPDAAVIKLQAEGSIGLDGVTCSVQTSRALIEAASIRRPAATASRPAPATCCSRRWWPARASRSAP